MRNDQPASNAAKPPDLANRRNVTNGATCDFGDVKHSGLFQRTTGRPTVAIYPLSKRTSAYTSIARIASSASVH